MRCHFDLLIAFLSFPSPSPGALVVACRARSVSPGEGRSRIAKEALPSVRSFVLPCSRSLVQSKDRERWNEVSCTWVTGPPAVRSATPPGPAVHASEYVQDNVYRYVPYDTPRTRLRNPSLRGEWPNLSYGQRRMIPDAGSEGVLSGNIWPRTRTQGASTSSGLIPTAARAATTAAAAALSSEVCVCLSPCYQTPGAPMRASQRRPVSGLDGRFHLWTSIHYPAEFPDNPCICPFLFLFVLR